MDDDEFELDMETGKFVQKEKVMDKPDESTSRKRKQDSSAKPSDTGDESRSRSKRSKKTDAVPLLEDDDEDLMIVDDMDKDADYEPRNDDELDNDQQDYPAFDDDDDDFQIPPLRSRKSEKPEKKERKQTKKKVDTARSRSSGR